MTEAAVKKPASTRERMIELAEQMVLRKGFASTSIEELIAGVGITKSGFFYHFKDKYDLARAHAALSRRQQTPDGSYLRARRRAA
jgi:AcrR family transcriptional regulator